MMKKYAKMAEPLIIGSTKLRNRVVMGSMHTGLEHAEMYPRLAKFYEERAKGGAGLIITGGFPPCDGIREGELAVTKETAPALSVMTEAVHKYDSKIVLQILHSGRYASGGYNVAPSPIQAPINRTKPKEMTLEMIKDTVQQFVDLAVNAQTAGFDGVEIMGSEGYLLNQFLVRHTNKRTDEYGGSYENRMRFPLEVVRAVREATGKDFLIVFRISLLDMVPEGSTQAETYELAERVIAEGADVLNSGIGWHEARVPTIATSVPRAGFTWVTRALRKHLRSKGLDTPVIAVNRMNHPDVLEQVLEDGDADLVSMARPWLTDPHFVEKALRGDAKLINVCIACNEACLDHTFSHKSATCMLNPMAGYEEELAVLPAEKPKKVAVVGGGPAGSHSAITLAQRGHHVTLFERSDTLGGQLNLAKRVPGKEEFQSAINYWSNTLQALPNVTVKLNTEVTPQMMAEGGFDEVIVATGCTPRAKTNDTIQGIEGQPNVLNYVEALKHPERVGKRVAVIGSGGIGFDMCEYLTAQQLHGAAPRFEKQDSKPFAEKWGLDMTLSSPGGQIKPKHEAPAREVTMFQRKKGKIGGSLGPTTGWIHRLEMRINKVRQLAGVDYKAFDGKVFTYEMDGKEIKEPFDTVVLCTGQVSDKSFVEAAPETLPMHAVGGCTFTKRLDAKLAIRQAHEVMIKL